MPIVPANFLMMAIQRISWTVAKLFSVYFCFVLLFSSQSEAKRKAIEEIPRRQLDTLITSEDYLAVFWRKSKFFDRAKIKMKLILAEIIRDNI